MNLDFTRLASDLRRAHALGLPYSLPAMTMRQLSTLIALLDEQPVSTLLH